MSLQTVLLKSLIVALIIPPLCSKLADISLQLHIGFLLFITTFLGQITCFTLYTVLLAPRLSPLRDLPQAHQPPLLHRLFKEPNAFHFEKWINQVENDGFIRYFGFMNMERVLLTRPAGVRQVLHTQSYTFEKQYAQRTHLRRLADRGLVTAEGDVHKYQRKIVNVAFKAGSIRDVYLPLFWSKTAQMLDVMFCSMRRSPEEFLNPSHVYETSQTLAMDDIVGRAVFDIIGQASLGYDFQSLANPDFFYNPLHDYRKAFEPSPAMRKRILLAFFLPAWIINALPIKFNRTTGAAIDRVRKLCSVVIKERRTSNPKISDIEKAVAKKPSVQKSLIDDIIATNKLTSRELLDQAMMLQAGGIHTSHAVLLSAIWFLAQAHNHHIQDKLRAEIRATLPSCVSNSIISPSAFDNAPYLDAVRKEVLRLHATFSWTGRTPIKTTTVCGQIIPKGTAVSLSPWAMHRSFSLWGEDANDFKPERWLDGKQHTTIPKESCSYIPFGAGPRICVGEKFAKAELNCLLAGLFGRFSFTFEGLEIPGVTQQVTVAFRKELLVQVKVMEGW